MPTVSELQAEIKKLQAELAKEQAAQEERRRSEPWSDRQVNDWRQHIDHKLAAIMALAALPPSTHDPHDAINKKLDKLGEGQETILFAITVACVLIVIVGFLVVLTGVL